MELFLIRHGESLGNVCDVDMPDPLLTPLGRVQAEHLGRLFQGASLDAVVASPLYRSLQTATPIALANGLEIKVWSDLVEHRGLGPYVGPKPSELRLQYPIGEMDPLEVEGWVYDGQETREACRCRALGVLRRFREAFVEGTRVAAVGHGTFNNILLNALFQSADVKFSQDNGCVNHLVFEAARVRARRLNDVSHLRAQADASTEDTLHTAG